MLHMERMTADQAKSGPLERDIHLAITALKKGSQLLKYGRRGKPKFCLFRLSNPIFQRYPRPEKEYQSFSLIYDDRSLDLICKGKDEAEVWFIGLKALISCGLQQKGRAETKSGVTSEANSPRSRTQRRTPLSSPFWSGDSSQKDEVEPFHPHATAESPPKVHFLEKALSVAMLYALPPKVPFPSDSTSDGMNGRTKGAGTDAFWLVYQVQLAHQVKALVMMTVILEGMFSFGGKA